MTTLRCRMGSFVAARWTGGDFATSGARGVFRHNRQFATPLHLACCLIAMAVLAGVTQADAPPARQVNGEVVSVGGLSVVRVWGTPEEQGYALGYLLGDRIPALWDGFVSTGFLGRDKNGAPALPPFPASMMKVPERYEKELHGMLAGIKTRTGGDPMLPSLKTPADLRRSAAAQHRPRPDAGWGARPSPPGAR